MEVPEEREYFLSSLLPTVLDAERMFLPGAEMLGVSRNPRWGEGRE